MNNAKKHKEEVADDLKEVFNLDLPEDSIDKRFARLGVLADKWRKTYKYIGGLTTNPNWMFSLINGERPISISEV